jgi:phosphoglycolate phosphatase
MPFNAMPLSCSPFDAALIDLDGTMVDTLGDFVAALALTLDELGLGVVERDFVERTIGKGSEHLLRTTLAEVGADPGHYEAAWNAYQRHYLAVNGRHAQVFPGVAEGLQSLRDAGLRLACLTNKPTAFALALLEAKGLAGFFERVHGGDAFERKKPHPMPLLETCKALGTVPARTLMVGDSRNDAEAGHAAGCPVVLVTYGYNHGEPIGQVPARLYLDRLDRWPAGWPFSPAGA